MTKKLFYNGDILTLEDELYAEAVLVEDGKIKAVGKKDELMIQNSDAEMIDLQGKTLMPSFIDAHSHFFGYANSKLQVSLEDAVDFEDIANRIKTFIEKNNVPEGVWINANNFDYNTLAEKTYPRIDFLDEVVPNNPIIIANKSGHNGLVNSLGMKELGITIDTPDPEGGVIFKENGKLNGYLEENAFINNVQRVPMSSTEDIMKAVLEAQNDYASYGITTMQEGMVVPLLADLLAYMAHSGMMKIDYIAYVDIREREKIFEKLQGCINEYKNHFKIGGFKTFLDGSPQGRTAYMRTDYQGEEGYRAYPVMSGEELEGLIEIALKENMQILAHCNGDAAVAQYLEQYKKAK